jgi:Ran-binding protein 3
MPLPDEQKQVTGEEEERSVFASEGVLFQLEDGQWKERGRGEMRCNLAPSGQSRLVMRQRGNLRLLLNANLWPDMKVITMDGNKVGHIHWPGCCDCGC